MRCVTIDHSNWDTHDGNFATLKNALLPQLDAGASARCSATWPTAACSTRTLVVVTGEFGRTPRINKNAGRDHWGPAFTVLLGGGGIQGGPCGRQDRRPRREAGERPLGPEDLCATMYHAAGHRPEGRVPHARRPAGRQSSTTAR